MKLALYTVALVVVLAAAVLIYVDSLSLDVTGQRVLTGARE